MTALARAAVGGFGASFGRDVYRTTKKNLVLLIAVGVALSATALPFLGGRNLVRGHQRGLFSTIVVTILGSMVLVALGFVAAFLVDFILQSFSRVETDPPVLPRYAAIATIVLMAAGVGLLVGLVERSSRLRRFRIVADNDAFLSRNDIAETGGRDVTHRDGAGNQLRFLEANKDSLVFMVVGRRGKRAFIDLDADGRMVSYSGAQS